MDKKQLIESLRASRGKLLALEFKDEKMYLAEIGNVHARRIGPDTVDVTHVYSTTPMPLPLDAVRFIHTRGTPGWVSAVCDELAQSEGHCVRVTTSQNTEHCGIVARVAQQIAGPVAVTLTIEGEDIAVDVTAITGLDLSSVPPRAYLEAERLASRTLPAPGETPMIRLLKASVGKGAKLITQMDVPTLGEASGCITKVEDGLVYLGRPGATDTTTKTLVIEASRVLSIQFD